MTTPAQPSQQATSPSTPRDAQRPWPLRAEADYEYRAADDEEVSFHKHDLLQVIAITGRWWTVKTPAGQFGLASSNYITLLPSIGPDEMPKDHGKALEFDPLTEKALQATTAGFASKFKRSQLEQRLSAHKAKVGYLWQNDKALAKLEGRQPPRFKPLRRLLDEIRRFVWQVQVAYECTMRIQTRKTAYDIAMYVGT